MNILIKGNLAEEVEKLKPQPGLDIVVGGGGRMGRSLMQYDLVDEYRLMVNPIVVGDGMRLFQDAKYPSLRLAETKTFSTGVVVLTYQCIGTSSSSLPHRQHEYVTLPMWKRLPVH